MQRILKMANQVVPEISRILEVNPKSPLIRRLFLGLLVIEIGRFTFGLF